MEEEKKTLMRKIKSFVLESKRVFRITKKPGREEFMIIVKISGIGILVIGAIGFIINMLWQLMS